MTKYTITKTKKIIISALLLASFIILDRLVTINAQFLAINLSLLPIMLAGMILGPKYSTIIAILGDLIGSILWPFGAYFVGFTITSGITGFIFGTLLYKKTNKTNKLFWIKAIVSNILVYLIVNILLNSLCLHIMYEKAFIYYLGLRVSTQTILLPIYIALIIALEKALSPIIKKYLYDEENIDVEEYLSRFDKFTKDPNLDVMNYLMDKFDNPHKKLKCIHIAGTNGKGSVAEMTNNCLIEAGYKVGKFISPHLVKFNDGITINNKEITDAEVKEILEPLSKEIEEYNKTHKVGVKWFEAITSLVFIYFEKQNCDFVVLETGLGGDVDCTNIADGMVSIITNIGLDHVDILGNTIQEIAGHKAGIIKANKDTVIVNQPEIIDVIKEKCREVNNNLHIVEPENITDYKNSENKEEFSYKNYKNIYTNLKGKVQIYNASQVLECMEVLKQKGYKISEEAIRKGLSTVVHRARMELISEEPLIIFDGGHNENAIKNLKSNIEAYYNENKHVYIISILKTKDYKTIIKELSDDKNAIFFLTNGNNKKTYVSKRALYSVAERYIDNDKLFMEDFETAIDIAKKVYSERTIFIVGSFYVYKDVVAKGNQND